MEENNYRFSVGVLVLASAIIGALLLVFFGAIPNFLVDRYRVTIIFRGRPALPRIRRFEKVVFKLGESSALSCLMAMQASTCI